MKRNILVVCAISPEMKVVKEQVKKLNIPNANIQFLTSWAWNYNTIYTLSEYIQTNWKPDFIVNLWMCGKKNPDVSTDIFQVYRVKNIANNREVIAPAYIEVEPLESILSSEKVITDPQDMLWENYVDMESYGIDFVATKYRIPYVLLKLPFDSVWKESKKVDVEDMQERLRNINYAKIITTVKEYCDENNLDEEKKQESKLLEYKNYFKFSFAENLIFIKNYNKFIAFGLEFREFFEENKELPKKEFLEKMKQIKITH